MDQDCRGKDASSWLTVKSIQEHGFAFTKSESRDALPIRYNKELQGMRSKCSCSQTYDLNHAVICKRGEFDLMTHNNVKDFEANLLKTSQNDI